MPSDANSDRSKKDNHAQSVAAMKARLERARRQATPEPPPDRRRSDAMGAAFRITIELVSGILVGGAIGWFIDDWLGTFPWFSVVFFLLGTAAGLFNVVRAAKELQSRNGESGD